MKKEELEALENLLYYQASMRNQFNPYDRIYPFTNEELTSWNGKFDVKEKNIFTVCGSGDQALQFLLQHPKSVTLFDINCYTKYYFEFKKALILSCSRDDFMYFFFGDNVRRENLNWRRQYAMFQSIQDKLSEDSKCFWEVVFAFIKENDEILPTSFLIENFLFFPMNITKLSLPYFKKENYEILQQELVKQEISFLNLNILEDDLSSLKMYDLIYLSNILEYVRNAPYFLEKDVVSKEKVRSFFEEKLAKHLNFNGQMVNYFLGSKNQSAVVEDLLRGEEGWRDIPLFPQIGSDHLLIYQKKK